MDEWLDEGAEGRAFEREMWRRNVAHMSEKHKNAGFKEVVSDAKDQTLQTGFNHGFRDGVVAGTAWGHLSGLLAALHDAPPAATRLDEGQRTRLAALVAELDALRGRRDFPSFAKAPEAAPLVAAAAAAVGKPVPSGAAPAAAEGCCGGGGCGGEGKGEGKQRDCGRGGCADEADLWRRCVRFLKEAQLGALADALPKLML